VKFGPVPIAEAEGAILVHGRMASDRRLRKGQTITATDIVALTGAGVAEIIVARLEPGDVGENAAADRIAAAVHGSGLRAGETGTGRVNLFAEADGIACFDTDAIDRINAIDEGITIATVGAFERVAARQIVATVKIIPLGVGETALAACEAAAAQSPGLMRVAPFRPLRAGLLQTTLPGLREQVLDKTVATLSHRLADLGSTLERELRCAHDEAAVAAGIAELRDAGAELILVLGASATIDRRDVVPAAIVAAGGDIDHFGMPVDPGNLLVLAHIGAIPVLALPGSARSPRLGGNDLVLQRLLAGIEVDGTDLMKMGVGGLLKEIPGRPMPRADAAPDSEREPTAMPRLAAIVLAGGQSRRMGERNKLMIEVDGEAMVAHAVDTCTAAGFAPVVVVTGHEAGRVRNLLADRAVIFAHNPDYAGGISTSLRAGIAALPDGIDGALVALGDMPRVQPEHLRRLAAAFDPAAGDAIVLPTRHGKRGNPVLWARRFFAEMSDVSGDVGARHIIGEHADLVREVEMDDDAVLIDVDSPEALAALGGDQPSFGQTSSS
jgi:molybdenum cofactor cytidylyltransferase